MNLSDIISGNGNPILNPMTTSGDTLYGGASGVPTRLAKGVDGQVLTLASGIPSWGNVASGVDYASGAIAINTATTLTIGRHHIISDLSSPADYEVLLPAVSGNAGKLISWEIAYNATKLVTVSGNDRASTTAQKIDNVISRVMWASESAVLYCNGTTWTKVGGKSIPMSFSAQFGSSNQLFSFNTSTKIQISSLVYANPASVSDLGNYQLLIKRTGTYYFKAGAATNGNNASATFWQNAVWKNNTTSLLTENCDIQANKVATTTCSGITSLTAGDSAALYCLFTTGSYTTSTIYNPGGAVLIMEEIVTW